MVKEQSEFSRDVMDGVVRAADAARWDAFIPSPSLQNHAASLARLPGGELACVWFGGSMEGMPDISIHMSVLDEANGKWSPAQIFRDDPSRSEQNTLLYTVRDGSVWLLYTSQISGNQETSLVRRRISHDGGNAFGVPHTLICAPGTFIRQATAAIRRRWTPAERLWRGRVAEARQEWLLRWTGVLKG